MSNVGSTTNPTPNASSGPPTAPGQQVSVDSTTGLVVAPSKYSGQKFVTGFAGGPSYKTAQRQRDRLAELEGRALIQAPAWATGQAYVAGQILRYGSSNPALIVATNSGTSGASLGAFSSQATFTDGTVTFVYSGRISGLANSSGREVPTISTSSSIPGGTTEQLFGASLAGISMPLLTNLVGGAGPVQPYWYDDGSNQNVTTGGVGLYAVTAVFEFVSDDPVLALSNQFGTITNTPIVYVGEIDGSDMVKIEESVTISNGSAPSYYIITWPGGRRERRYRVEMANVPASNIRGLCKGSLADVWAPAIDAPRCLVIDDSRAVTESPATITDASQYRAVRMAKLAGLRYVQCMGQGGAGYVAGSTPFHNGPNTAPLPLVFQNNNPLLSTIQFDVVIFVIGGNDVGVSSTTLTANALFCFQQARLNWPNARIQVFGPDDGRNNLSANALACEAAILAAFNTWIQGGESNAKFFPVLTDPRGCEITGTGNMGATTGVGNSDWYIGTDGTHPPRFSHEYIARRRAYLVDQDLTSVGL